MKELNHIEAIRILSGMFNPKQAVDILAIVNLIARNYLGDASDSFTEEQLGGIGIKLKRADKKENLKDAFEKLCAREGINKTWNLSVDQFIDELINIARCEDKKEV